MRYELVEKYRSNPEREFVLAQSVHDYDMKTLKNIYEDHPPKDSYYEVRLIK